MQPLRPSQADGVHPERSRDLHPNLAPTREAAFHTFLRSGAAACERSVRSLAEKGGGLGWGRPPPTFHMSSQPLRSASLATRTHTHILTFATVRKTCDSVESVITAYLQPKLPTACCYYMFRKERPCPKSFQCFLDFFKNIFLIKN